MRAVLKTTLVRIKNLMKGRKILMGYLLTSLMSTYSLESLSLLSSHGSVNFSNFVINLIACI